VILAPLNSPYPHFISPSELGSGTPARLVILSIYYCLSLLIFHYSSKCVQFHRRVPISSSGLASLAINLQTQSSHFLPSTFSATEKADPRTAEGLHLVTHAFRCSSIISVNLTQFLSFQSFPVLEFAKNCTRTRLAPSTVSWTTVAQAGVLYFTRSRVDPFLIL